MKKAIPEHSVGDEMSDIAWLQGSDGAESEESGDDGRRDEDGRNGEAEQIHAHSTRKLAPPVTQITARRSYHRYPHTVPATYSKNLQYGHVQTTKQTHQIRHIQTSHRFSRARDYASNTIGIWLLTEQYIIEMGKNVWDADRVCCAQKAWSSVMPERVWLKKDGGSKSVSSWTSWLYPPAITIRKSPNAHFHTVRNRWLLYRDRPIRSFTCDTTKIFANKITI